MSLGASQLKRMAEILRVDEIVEYNLLSPTYGFAIRIGQLWEKVEIDDSSVLAVNSAAMLDRLIKRLFDAARALKARVKQMERRDAAPARRPPPQRGRSLRSFIDSARPIVPAKIEFVPLSAPTSGIFAFDEWFGYKVEAVSLALGMDLDTPPPRKILAETKLALDDVNAITFVADSTVPADQFEIRTPTQAVTIELGGTTRAPTNRFEAIAQELETT